jgi:hypothetical protein
VCADLAILGVVAIAAFVPRPCANRLEFDRELPENERSDEIPQPMAEPFTKVAGNRGLIGQEDRPSRAHDGLKPYGRLNGAPRIGGQRQRDRFECD